MKTTQHLSKNTYLILGGARSGKSGYAEKIAISSNQDVVYVATANTFDDEMVERVKQHQNDRPSHWLTVEEPIALAESLLKHDAPNKVMLVDCLTLWINNLLMQENEDLLLSETKKLLEILDNLSATVILVSNEVGMGIVPMGELSRKFIDESGRLHQQLAQHVDHVLLMVAGLALVVKGTKPF